MKRLTIKMRMTLWYTLFMTVLVFLCLAAILAIGAQTIKSNSREMLVAAVSDSFHEIEYDDDDRRIEIEDDLALYQDGIYLCVYDQSGKLLAGSLPQDFPMDRMLSSRLFQTASEGRRQWYYYDQVQNLSGYGQIWVRGIMAADNVNQAFGTIYKVAVIGMPFIVLFAALGGYMLAGRALRPVSRITEAAGQIAKSRDLSMRIGLGEGRDEIYTLANTFDKMFDRLQAAFDNEKQFTSDASHELRTPVSVIIAQCEYALEQAQTLDEAKAALSTVLEQAQRMSGLIYQLLTLARADRGHEKLLLEVVNLSELTEIVAAWQQEKADRKHITVHMDIEPNLLIRADETMMMRLLINLMENGIRYGREGGNLWVSLHEKEGVLECIIADDGIGIAKEHLPKIWERFYQVDESRTDSDGSTGLGLSMVKWIAEAHGGKVTVQSVPDEGSQFTFTFSKNDIL